MKKKIVAIVLGLSMCIGLTGCGSGDITPTNNKLGNKYFDLVDIYKTENTKVSYDKNTKVMYFIEEAGYSFGITPIYNSDGTLKLYEAQ